MRKNIPVIFVISALVVLVLCSACVFSPPAGQKPQQEGGLTQVNVPVESSRISFEEVKQKFEDYHRITHPDEKLPVYYIFSRDVDSSGNAQTWLFGVRHSTGTDLLMYDRAGWKIIPWSATLPSEEIILDQVVSPNTLFIKNKDAIFSASSPSIQERRDLVLKEVLYTLTITTENTSRILTFNATSGALITKV
jgi:hypothetical protein